MTDTDRGGGSLSGLTGEEAREFHKFFVQGFIVFTLIAIVAHVLVWMWRPWIPGPEGYTTSLNSVKDAALGMLPYLT